MLGSEHRNSNILVHSDNGSIPMSHSKAKPWNGSLSTELLISMEGCCESSLTHSKERFRQA
eukprot:02955.XXX_50053_50235_1 [CDS] Oithona nana genome sequencing.